MQHVKNGHRSYLQKLGPTWNKIALPSPRPLRPESKISSSSLLSPRAHEHTLHQISTFQTKLSSLLPDPVSLAVYCSDPAPSKGRSAVTGALRAWRTGHLLKWTLMALMRASSSMQRERYYMVSAAWACSSCLVSHLTPLVRSIPRQQGERQLGSACKDQRNEFFYWIGTGARTCHTPHYLDIGWN